MESIISEFIQYGALGAMLAYFVINDKMSRKASKEQVERMREMLEHQQEELKNERAVTQEEVNVSRQMFLTRLNEMSDSFAQKIEGVVDRLERSIEKRDHEMNLQMKVMDSLLNRTLERLEKMDDGK